MRCKSSAGWCGMGSRCACMRVGPRPRGTAGAPHQRLPLLCGLVLLRMPAPYCRVGEGADGEDRVVEEVGQQLGPAGVGQPRGAAGEEAEERPNAEGGAAVGEEGGILPAQGGCGEEAEGERVEHERGEGEGG
eukprot:scaffold17543_cov99-Isochrysis_galbana.AAC.3